MLDKVARSLYRVVIPASRIASHVGAGFLVVLMVLIVADVIMRYFFNSPIPGVFELTEQATGLVVVLSLAYCALEKGHINVDLVISRFSKKGQAVFGSIAAILGIGIIFIMVWQTAGYVKVMFRSGQSTTTLLIPLFPFITVTTIGLTLFLLVLIGDFLDLLSKAMK